MNYYELSKDNLDALYAARNSLNNSPLAINIRALAELRTSQINGCNYCTKLHTQEALEAGIEPKKVEALVHWRDSDLFNQKERAALQWIEETTTLDDFDNTTKAQLSEHFSEREIVDLTLCVSIMGALNRIAILLRHY